MAIAKVILNGDTLMDVTSNTNAANNMLSGITGTKNDGTKVTGNIASKSSTDLTVSGATVTAPAGYYANVASKTVAAGSAFPPAVTITKAPTIGVNTSGVVTASYNGSSSITPTVNAGYVSQGTAGTISTTGTSTYQLTSKAAATYYPSTADQTIASQRWLVGNQTIKSVVTSNLTAANIAEGVTVKVGDANNASCITQVTGTHSGKTKYTATIVGTGSTSTTSARYAVYNSINYFTDGETFTFAAGDSVILRAQRRSNYSYIKINGEVVATGNDSLANYWYTLPACDVVIDLTTNGEVNLIVATIEITENGNYEVAEYGYANVNVSPDEGFTVAQIAMRTMAGSISGNATTIGSYAFYNCRSITGASFSLATTIHGHAFYGCSSLSTVNFPSAQYIWSSAFYGCTTLSAANFSSVKTIASNAFRSCHALTTASFPSASSIANYAFYACSKLSSLYLLGSSVASLGGTSVFTQTQFSLSSAGVYGSIFVPSSLYNSYLTATYWSAYSARIVSV